MFKETKFEEFKRSEERQRSLSEILRERWLNLIKGREELENFEEIDFSKILPNLKFWFGEKFEFQPGSWWKTRSVLDEKILYYPRKFGRIPKDLPEELKKKQIEIQKGGLLHEAGHHLGVVKVLEKFILEADTQERILGDLSLGEASREEIREAIKRGRKEIEQVAERVNIGPYAGNLIFLKDLHNLVLDIWLEAYEQNYPEKELAIEAKKALEAINQELFPGIPQSCQNELLSSQFKKALLLKKMRSDLKEWGESGYDLWFKEGLFSEEVQESLKRIKDEKIFETLVETEGLKEILMPKERINWVKKEKLQKAYFGIRKEYIKLLIKDFEKLIQEKAKNLPLPPGEGPVGPGKGKPKPGEVKPINFDDLPPEIQEEIINQILDQLEDEEVGTEPVAEEEGREEERRNILRLSREVINQEIRRRKTEKEEKKPEEKEEKKKPSEKEKEIESEFARRSYERQIHVASEMGRAELLGLTLEQLRIFEERKRELEPQISYLANTLIELLKNKMEAELKTHQPMGHLMPGKFGDYLRGVKEGKEPKVFQYFKLKGVIPAIDLLFLVDHSGSMESLDKNKKAADCVLLFGEAFLRTERELDKILSSSRKKREYLREGLITFSDTAILRKPLETKLDEKTIAQLYFTAKNISGGGTADAEALRNLINYLKTEETKHKGRYKVLKIVAIITDGQGEREKVKDVLETARNLPNTLFIAVGAGSDTEDVLDTWKKDLPGVEVVPVHVKDEEMSQMPQKIIKESEKSLIKKVREL